MPYSYSPPKQSAADISALLAANRLEARPRSAEFNRALRAEVRDATWLLARQWQLHEFRAEDRGTPAYAEVRATQLPLSQLALPGQPTARPYAPAHQPLEAAVEAQPRPLGLGLRLQMGEYWLRQVRTEPSWAAALAAAPDADSRAAAQNLFALLYPLAWPTKASPVAYAQHASTPEVLALQAVAGPAAFDGYQLYQALLAPLAAQLGPALADSDALAQALAGQDLVASLAANPALATATGPLAQGLAVLGRVDGAAFAVLARQFVLAMHRLYLLGTDAPGTWSAPDMAYSFGVSTDGAAQAVGLGTPHYPGGGTLPWYALDAQAAPAGTPAAPAPEVRRVLPTEVQFPGAPAARWWEFEDRRVDFGQLTGDPSDWGRMLLQEFMFLYQNDWFSIPYTLDTGRVVAVQSVRVTDVFGRTYALEPAGAGTQPEPGTSTLIDNDAGRWRLFAQTPPAAAGSAAPAPQLYLPAAALAPLVGRPVEQVSFRREEATNLVWAVETIVPDGFGGGLDGSTAAGQLTEALRRLAPAAATTAAEPTTYTYQLASPVPENWVPFVPAPPAAGAPTLLQGALPRQVPGLPSLPAVAPRTSLLLLGPTAPYVLHEHELPPAGLRVEGLPYRARWYGGRAVGWFGRQRGPALPGGSSGLAFDVLAPGTR